LSKLIPFKVGQTTKRQHYITDFCFIFSCKNVEYYTSYSLAHVMISSFWCR